jgi:hypothetical protein
MSVTVSNQQTKTLIQSTSVNHMDITKAAFQFRNNNISISTKLTLLKLFMQATAFYRSWGSYGAHCHSSADIILRRALQVVMNSKWWQASEQCGHFSTSAFLVLL